MAILQYVRYMMLVDNSVVSCLRINMFGRIERFLSVVFHFPVGKVTAPELDKNAPLAVGFLKDRVIVQDYIIIFVQRQSARSVSGARVRTRFELSESESAGHVLAIDEPPYHVEASLPMRSIRRR